MKKFILAVLRVVCGEAVFRRQFTVAVSPFDIRSGFAKDEAEVIFELFASELAGARKLKVVDRNSFDKMAEQLNFQNTDWPDNDKVAQLGKALNANSIIRCVLMKMGEQLIITASILDMNTAQILSSSNIRMKNINEIFTQLPIFVKQLVAKLSKLPPPPPPSIVGTWRDMGGDTITIEFKNDGTFAVENWVFSKNNGTQILDMRYIGIYKQEAGKLVFDYVSYVRRKGDSHPHSKLEEVKGRRVSYTIYKAENRSSDRLTLCEWLTSVLDPSRIYYTRFMRVN